MNEGKIVIGVQPVKPVKTGLPGRHRLRFREHEFADIFIRDAFSIRQFMLLDCGTHYEPALDFERNANYRPSPAVILPEDGWP